MSVLQLLALWVAQAASPVQGPAISDVWARSTIRVVAAMNPALVQLVCPLPTDRRWSSTLVFAVPGPSSFTKGSPALAELFEGHLLALVPVGETEGEFMIPGDDLLVSPGRIRVTWSDGRAGELVKCSQIEVSEPREGR